MANEVTVEGRYMKYNKADVERILDQVETIDTTPTPDSNNPITSDAVANVNGRVDRIVGNEIVAYTEADLVQGFYGTATLVVGGTINDKISGKSNPDLRCGKFVVKAGDEITICTSLGNASSSKARPYVLTDASGTAVLLSELGADVTTPVTITAENDGFLYVCERLSSMTGHTFGVEIRRLSDNGLIPELQKEMDEIKSTISMADKVIDYTESDLVQGYYNSKLLAVGDTFTEKISGKSDSNLKCGKFNVKAGDVVTICTSMNPSTGARPYFLTDTNKVVKQLSELGGDLTTPVTITVDDDGFLFVGEKLSAMTGYTFGVEIKRSFDFSVLPDMQDDIDALKEKVLVDDDVPLTVVKETPGLTAILHRIGVIGASLTNGGHNKTAGTFPTEAGREFSWPQRLARLCGTTCFNFGQAGIWCKWWLDDNGGYYTAVGDPEKKCDAYIISMASNDADPEKADYPLGTIADVHVGHEDQNGASYYGYFSQVIARCHEVQPRAYLFVLTYPHGFGTVESGGYTQAMRDIVEAYRTAGYNIYLIDYAAYGMNVDEANARGLKRGTHYVGAGYQYMTYEICTYIDWIIRHNIEDFKDVAFVRTTAEFVPTGGTPVGYEADDYFVDGEYLSIDIRRPRGVVLQEEFDAIFNLSEPEPGE